MENRRELEKYQATVKECESKRNHWQKEIEKLTIHRIPDEKEATELPVLSDEERLDIYIKFCHCFLDI